MAILVNDDDDDDDDTRCCAYMHAEHAFSPYTRFRYRVQPRIEWLLELKFTVIFFKNYRLLE